MFDKFALSLQTIVDEIAPAFQARTRQDIASIVAAGVRSDADVIALLEDRRRPAALRALACWFLARLNNRRALPLLLQALSDDDASLRSEAARSLAILGRRQATPAIIDALRKDENADVRFHAASALAMLNDGRSVEPLLQTLANLAEEPHVRGAAAESLARFDSPAVVPAMIFALDDESTEVRYWAAFALGELNDTRALGRLERLASSDDSISVREEAAAAITAIRNVQGDRPENT